MKPRSPNEEIAVNISLWQTGTITGRVVQEGKPLSELKVMLHRNDSRSGRRPRWPLAETVTDDDGRYKFEDVESGFEYFAYVERDQELDSTNVVQLSPGDVKELNTVEFYRLDKTVSGVVVDPEGNPIVGAAVSVSDRKTRKQFRRHHHLIRTDNQGHFTIEEVPDTPLRLMAYVLPSAGENTIRHWTEVSATPGQSDVKIVINPKLGLSK